MENKVTIAHLKFNYYEKEGNNIMGEKTLQEGYHSIAIPGEGPDVHKKMDMAVRNYAQNYGCFNLTTVTPEEYNKAKGIENESNTQI